MKMVKKILLGTLAVAAILTFASCGQREEAGNSELIDINAGSSKGSIDYTNDSEDTTRGFKTLQTKHLDAICHIETTVTELKGDNAKASGTMGYIFNVVKAEDGTYSFSIAGARYNQKSGDVEAYVETFKGIAADKLEENLTGGKKATGLSYGDTAFGFTLVEKTDVNRLLAAQTEEPKKLDLWIDLVANGKAKKDDTAAPKGRGGKEGTYTVTFYWKDPVRQSSAKSYDLTYGEAKGAAPATFAEGFLKSCTIEAADVNAAYDAEKGLTSMQSDVGFYANVYAGQTLKGTWKLDEIKKEAEEIEE